jgi:hypothetical protein
VNRLRIVAALGHRYNTKLLAYKRKIYSRKVTVVFPAMECCEDFQNG